VAQDGTFRELGLRVCLPAIMRRSLAFEAWKALLRNDCVGGERLQASDALGDATLRILYENGTDPTLEGVGAWWPIRQAQALRRLSSVRIARSTMCFAR
jgi:hypothetical protein